MNNLFEQKSYQDVLGVVAGSLLLETVPSLGALNNMRELNHDCKDKVDTVCQKTWGSFKDRRDEFLTQRQGEIFIQKKEELIQSKNVLIAKKDNAVEKLENRKRSWFGYFVSQINVKEGLISKITKIICHIFPSVSEEINKQNNLHRKIGFLEMEIQEVDPKITLQEYQMKALIDNKCDFANRFSGFLKIASLFGGNDGYELLPKINIKMIHVEVSPDQMSSPIMKGEDIHGNHFFVLRTRFRDNGEAFCPIFYENNARGTWFSQGNCEITKTGRIIVEKDKLMNDPFDHLAEFIKNKGNDILELF